MRGRCRKCCGLTQLAAYTLREEWCRRTCSCVPTAMKLSTNMHIIVLGVDAVNRIIWRVKRRILKELGVLAATCVGSRSRSAFAGLSCTIQEHSLCVDTSAHRATVVFVAIRLTTATLRTFSSSDTNRTKESTTFLLNHSSSSITCRSSGALLSHHFFILELRS